MFNKFLSILFLVSSSTAFAAFEEGVIVEEGQSRDWMAEKVFNHDVWNKPACVAYTKGSDKASFLEVVAFYDEATDSFLEPFVSVSSPFDVSFFEATIATERTSTETFNLVPVLVEGASMVSAKALFNDRESLTAALRRRNRVTAKYFDSEGLVKETRFSLSGSSKAIKAQFDACKLSFSKLPATLPEVELLP